MEKLLRVFRAHSRIPAGLELIHFCRSGRKTRAANGRKVLAPLVQCGQLHHPICPTVPPTPYFFLYEIFLGYNVISFNINIHHVCFSFFPLFLFYFMFFYLNFLLFFCVFQDVPGCSGMFHVPSFIDSLRALTIEISQV